MKIVGLFFVAAIVATGAGCARGPQGAEAKTSAASKGNASERAEVRHGDAAGEGAPVIGFIGYKSLVAQAKAGTTKADLEAWLETAGFKPLDKKKFHSDMTPIDARSADAFYEFPAAPKAGAGQLAATLWVPNPFLMNDVAAKLEQSGLVEKVALGDQTAFGNDYDSQASVRVDKGLFVGGDNLPDVQRFKDGVVGAVKQVFQKRGLKAKVEVIPEEGVKVAANEPRFRLRISEVSGFVQPGSNAMEQMEVTFALSPSWKDPDHVHILGKLSAMLDATGDKTTASGAQPTPVSFEAQERSISQLLESMPSILNADAGGAMSRTRRSNASPSRVQQSMERPR